MWKKSDEPLSEPESPLPPRGRVEQRSDYATIGPSISIKGDVTGDENLVIQGRVEGKVNLKQNNVTVGRHGQVKADIDAKVIVIEGETYGDLRGNEKVVIKSSGAVIGNITAPRVVLEEGARFKGSIDMEFETGKASEHEKPASAASKSSPAPTPEKSEAQAKGSSTGSAVGAGTSPQRI